MGNEPAVQIPVPKPTPRRPVVPLALSLCAGVVCYPWLGGGVWLALAVVATVAAWGCRRWWIGSVFLLVAVAAAGGALARCEFERFRADEIALLSTDSPRLGFFEVELTDDPAVVSGQFGLLRELPPKQVVSADVRAVKLWSGWSPASGHVLLQIDGVHPRLSAGQRVRVFAELQRPAAPANPGQFDWSAFYRQQRVLVTLTVPHVQNVTLIGEPAPSLRFRLRREALWLLAAGFPQVHALEAALLSSLLLGDREAVLRQEWPVLQQAVVAYQLSVSGLHVALLGAAVWFACRLMRWRPVVSLLVATGLSLGYAAVAIPSFSGMRAVLAAVLVAAAVLLRRSLDRFQLLATVGLLIVLWQPLDVFTLGLQLSAAVVLAVALLLPAVERWWIARQNLHERLAPQQHLTRWQKRRRWLAKRLWQTAVVGVIAWLAVLPVAVTEFGLLNPWAPIIGTALLPLVLICLAAGVMKVVFTLAWPIGAAVWAAGATVPVGWVRRLAEWVATLPGSSVAVHAPPGWMIPLYYALLLLPLLPTRWIAGRRRWALRVAPAVGVLGVLVVPSPGPGAGPATGLRVTLLSIGAGQCAVVQPPGNASALMIDAGSSTVNDVVRTVVAPYFRAQGITRVEQIFLSHGDYDHISAAGAIAAAYGTREVYISTHFRPNAVANMPDQALLSEFDGMGLVPRLISRGDTVDLGGGVKLAVLWPPADGELNSNNAGLVLRVTYAGRSVLFPADIQDPAFAGLLVHPAELRSDVLVAAHHGSSETLTPAFLRAVAPRFIVSSNASRLTVKQKVFDRMVGSTPLYRTSEFGAITVTISPSGEIALETFRRPESGLTRFSGSVSPTR